MGWSAGDALPWWRIQHDVKTERDGFLAGYDHIAGGCLKAAGHANIVAERRLRLMGSGSFGCGWACTGDVVD